MLIYLMRHGETDWNVLRRMQGRSDIPLNANGLSQARDAANEMADIPFDRIFSSPLTRARQTAAAVARGRELTVTVEPLLIEMGFGDLEGVPRFEYPEQCEVIFTDPERYVPVGGGETYQALDLRCQALLEEFIPALEGQCQTVLMCSHGGFIKGVVRRLKGRPLRDFWIDPPQANCARTLLECEQGRVRLIQEGAFLH